MALQKRISGLTVQAHSGDPSRGDQGLGGQVRRDRKKTDNTGGLKPTQPSLQATLKKEVTTGRPPYIRGLRKATWK